jgi:hypothetical protein
VASKYCHNGDSDSEMAIFKRAKSEKGVIPLPQILTIFDLKFVIFFLFSVVLVTTDQATDIYAAFNHFKGPSIYYVTKTTGWVGLENGSFC